MCFLTRCEICGALMEYEDYFAHAKVCKPELEKVEVTATQNVSEKKKKVK
ncbi:MAG: hypothetical protein ACRD32_01765 [Nitrososphaerales archaeon]